MRYAWPVFSFLLVLACAVFLTTPAMAQSFSGTTGMEEAAPPPVKTPSPAQPPVPPRPAVPEHLRDYFGPDGKMALPPGQEAPQGMPWDMPHLQQQPQRVVPQAAPQPAARPQQPQQPQRPQAPAAPVQQQPEQDPCAAYRQNPQNYAICRDRVMRLERMRDAQQRRSQGADEQRRQREEQQRQAEEQRQQQERSRRVRRPGQVDPPPRQPLPVEVIEIPRQ